MSKKPHTPSQLSDSESHSGFISTYSHPLLHQNPAGDPSGSRQTSPVRGASVPRQLIYGYGPKLRVQKHPGGPSLTKQEFRDECNINVIMAQYMKTGVLDFVSKHPAVYQEVPDLDYYDAMTQIAQARSMFNDLPASIRSRFENDPGQFLDFVHDPENREEMRSMGLLRPDAPEAPNLAPAPPISPTPSPSNPQGAKDPLSDTSTGGQKGAKNAPLA